MNDAAYEKWLSQFTIMGDEAYSPDELPYELRQRERSKMRLRERRQKNPSQKFLADSRG